MRQLATSLLGLMLLLPAAASARAMSPDECRYLTTQIEFFQGRLDRAQKLGNDVWETRLSDHLDKLKAQREEGCPGYGGGAEAMKAFERLLELAAQGAVTFFTMGAF